MVKLRHILQTKDCSIKRKHRIKGRRQTAIRVSDITGSFSAGETFTLKSVDGSSTLGSGTIDSKDPRW